MNITKYDGETALPCGWKISGFHVGPVVRTQMS
jgi:hypothetical protein